MTRVERLAQRQYRRRQRTVAVAALAVLALVATVGTVAYAAVSQIDHLYVCVDSSGHAVRGWWAYERQCQSNEQQVRVGVQGVPGASTTTTHAPTTTTTAAPSGSIVPAGGACPRSTSSSTYEGNRLTQAQAAQALYAAGFRTLATIRAFVGISSAEASLCVRVWHWHPEFGPGQADVGPWQISTHFWPQFPQSQTLDPVGAAHAVAVIFNQTHDLGTWDTWPSPAQSQQPSAATVCAAIPATGC